MKVFRKRYLYLAIRSRNGEISDEEVIKEINNSFLNFFGFINLKLSRLKIEEKRERGLILSVDHKFLKETIAAITFVGRAERKGFVIDVLGISGTIKSLINKVESEI